MILVTGGMGFIGMHTTRKLLDAGESVVVAYNNAQREPNIWKDEIGEHVLIERVDTTNPHAVLEAGVKHEIKMTKRNILKMRGMLLTTMDVWS